MNAYIVAGYRSAVGKAPRGSLRFVRPDDLAAYVIKHLVHSLPNFDVETIDDVIVGNATPEAEQGLNIARMISLMALNTVKVPGVTINRYCASGLETIATAAAKIHSGQAHCIIAGGVECMSAIPFGGWRIVPNAQWAHSHPDYYWNMGLTAEAVAREFNVSREAQDTFALQSNLKAAKAIADGVFNDAIVPYPIEEIFLDAKEKRQTRQTIFKVDEGPRADTTLEKLATLKPVFDQKGTVTAGNASQTSDGAAFVLLMSEAMIKSLNIKPIARLMSYHVAALEPRIMGMGPVYAVPQAIKKAGLILSQINLIELNEAFASQSIAVINQLELDAQKVNIHGGAIALGHPLGCSGAKLSVQLINALQQQNGKYGLVTMCVGTGQGAAGVFERL
ncbi:MAG: acetyl-CoA C-acyltransferase [Bacteroidia bacterium]|nr:acetyl-CoA C-acyltransferase [Bacteroidia bacterium]